MSATSLANLHERLGKLLAGGRPTFHAGDHDYSVRDTYFRDMQIESYVRPIHVPTDTGDLRQLQAEWDETERLMGEAQDLFRQHRDRARFRRETAEIMKS